MKNFIFILSSILVTFYCHSAAAAINSKGDSTKTNTSDSTKLLPKVTHAEPLYVDLMRDLGARKGEKEWNLGAGVSDFKSYDAYNMLVEYEFAPINRLGLEVELPFSFYKNRELPEGATPKNRWEGIKLAAQYTFLVSEKYGTSLAAGYIQEFELPAFSEWGDERMIPGAIYNPIFVAAKRWGKNWHSLIYTGPIFIHEFHENTVELDYEFNASIHYMIPGSHNFIGVEMDSEHFKGKHVYMLRPQIKMKIAERTNLGLVFSAPVKRDEQNFGGFIRLIYEPK